MTSTPPRAAPSLHVRLEPCPEPSELAAAWQALERLAAPSFFTSWTWIGCWLRHLPAGLRPLLLRVDVEAAPGPHGLKPPPAPMPGPASQNGTADAAALGLGSRTFATGGTCVGLGLLVPHRTRRLRCWPSHGLLLHATGQPALDAITIEHNGLLAQRAIEGAVHRAALLALLGRTDETSPNDAAAASALGSPARVDHVRLPGIAMDVSGDGSVDGSEDVGGDVPDSAVVRLLDGLRAGGLLVHRDTEPAWRAHLADPDDPAAARDIVAGLGAGTRASIRRSLRRYADLGPVVLEAAADGDEALHFLQRLKHWHQTQWTARGEPGAFANPSFEAFHRDLITKAWPRGEVELLRLRAGSHEVGLLYNFVHHGTVSTYQSGLNQGLLAGNHHPGLVLHALAMQRAREAGHLTYDFLAGDARHKRQLGGRPYAMQTIHLSRPGAVARLEAAWRAFKAARAGRAFKAARAGRADAPRPAGRNPPRRPDLAAAGADGEDAQGH